MTTPTTTTLLYKFKTPAALSPDGATAQLVKHRQRVSGYNVHAAPNTAGYGLAGNMQVSMQNPTYHTTEEFLDPMAAQSALNNIYSVLYNHAAAINEMRDIISWIAANKPDALSEYTRWHMVSERLSK